MVLPLESLGVVFLGIHHAPQKRLRPTGKQGSHQVLLWLEGVLVGLAWNIVLPVTDRNTSDLFCRALNVPGLASSCQTRGLDLVEGRSLKSTTTQCPGHRWPVWPRRQPSSSGVWSVWSSKAALGSCTLTAAVPWAHGKLPALVLFEIGEKRGGFQPPHMGHLLTFYVDLHIQVRETHVQRMIGHPPLESLVKEFHCVPVR